MTPSQTRTTDVPAAISISLGPAIPIGFPGIVLGVGLGGFLRGTEDIYSEDDKLRGCLWRFAMDVYYGFGKTTKLTFDAALLRVTEELGKEGFGVLADID